MPLNVPILLTWLRILTIPLVIGVFYVPEVWLSSGKQNLIATSLFIAAATTDWLDGYLARRLGQTSAFGAFLDPVADKLMIAAALIVLVMLDRADAWLAIIIIGRETAITALLLYQPLIPGIDTILLGTVALWVAATLTLWSMFHYLRLAAPHLSG